jgi:Integrase core domain
LSIRFRTGGSDRDSLGEMGSTVEGVNCNAYAERFIRSVKEECLNRLVIVGEMHLRRTLVAFTEHYHRERNHQGLQYRLIMPEPMAIAWPHPLSCAARWAASVLLSSRPI